MTSIDDRDFLATVSEESGLEPADARILVEDFLTALAGYVPTDAWEIIASAVPLTVDVDAEPGRQVGSTPKDFILEMSHEEGVGDRDSALHARAVAETIGSRLGEEQRNRLAELVDEDFLALFESSGRGELTEQGGVTPGTKRLIGEDAAREKRGPSDVIETEGERLG